MTTMRVLGAVMLGAGLLAGCGGGGGSGGGSTREENFRPPPIPTDNPAEMFRWGTLVGDRENGIGGYFQTPVLTSGSANYAGVVAGPVSISGSQANNWVGRVDFTQDWSGTRDTTGSISQVAIGSRADNSSPFVTIEQFAGTLALDGIIVRDLAGAENGQVLWNVEGDVAGNLTGSAGVSNWSGDASLLFTRGPVGAAPNYFEGIIDNGAISGQLNGSFQGDMAGTRVPLP